MSLAEPWEHDIECWYEPVLLEHGFGLRVCPDADAWMKKSLSPGGECERVRSTSNYDARPFRDAGGWTTYAFSRETYRANAIAGAELLNLLVTVLARYEGPRISGRTQLITIDYVGTYDRMGGGSVAVSISPKLAAWIASHGRGHHFPAIAEAIGLNAYPGNEEIRQHAYGADAFVLGSGKMTFELGISISLGPADPNEWYGGGWSTHANNMDHPVGHFGILCGVGRLHGLAREAGL